MSSTGPRNPPKSNTPSVPQIRPAGEYLSAGNVPVTTNSHLPDSAPGLTCPVHPPLTEPEPAEPEPEVIDELVGDELLKDLLSQRQQFLDGFKRSRKGNLCCHYEGMTLTVFYRFRGYSWSVHTDDDGVIWGIGAVPDATQPGRRSSAQPGAAHDRPDPGRPSPTSPGVHRQEARRGQDRTRRHPRPQAATRPDRIPTPGRRCPATRRGRLTR